MNSHLVSAELLLRDVVHRQVVHVGLEELQGLVLDHSHSCWVYQLSELLDLVVRDTLAVLGGLKSLLQNSLNIGHALSTLSHAEAEVSEPLVVECNGPVLAEELNSIWNNALLVPCGKGVKVVLMQPNEAPETLKHNLFASHVGD
jgi:hypothetical protein